MALRAPNPALATETVTVNRRTVTRDASAGSSFAPGATDEYPAIVTMQIVNHEAIVVRSGSKLSQSLWDVLLFHDTDPLVVPDDLLAVQGQSRNLIATKRSTYREAGAWYVLCQTTE